MSSPTILTVVFAPFEEAHAANVQEMKRYLELATELYQQAGSLRAEIAVGGGKLFTDTLPTPQQAAARANALLHDERTAGYAGVEYAHAYWQEVKHPWFDRIVQQHGEVRAAANMRSVAEQARIGEVAQQAALVLNVEVDVDRLTVAAPAARATGWSTKIAATLEVILKHADGPSVAALESVIAASASMEPRERFMALEALRIKVGQESKEREQSAALRLCEMQQTALASERIEQLLERGHRRMESLESDSASALEKEWQDVAASMLAEGGSLALEERAQVLEQKTIQAIRQQGLMEAAVASLRQQGYETVQVMETIGPPHIASIYMQDARDGSRMALLQVAAERGTLAAEVVRRQDSNGSQQQKQLDKEAQSRLCKAMEAVENALASKWTCSVARRVEAGSAEPRIRKDIAAKSRRMRVAPALNSRAVN